MKVEFNNGFWLLVLFASGTANAAWDGTLDWARRTEMSTPASGVVERVLVRAGERVREKTVLLQLEQSAERARVKQAKAALKHTTLLHAEAERELNRAQELYDRTLLADHDLNIAKLAFAEADATYQKANADLLEAEEALADSELYAPFDAVILERRVQPAETVIHQLQAETMLVVASSKEMLVRIVIPADEIGQLSPGKGVKVECRGKSYQGVVESLRLDTSAAFTSSTSSGYSVEIIFPTEEQLLPGTAASVSLP